MLGSVYGTAPQDPDPLGPWPDLRVQSVAAPQRRSYIVPVWESFDHGPCDPHLTVTRCVVFIFVVGVAVSSTL